MERWILSFGIIAAEVWGIMYFFDTFLNKKEAGRMGKCRYVLWLDEEETVILLSNLLDNAIHEGVRVVQAGRRAVIRIKLVQKDGKLIFAVKNPVVEKVQITDGIFPDSGRREHGIGLANVKTVVEKYGGDFAISCDSENFQAVAIL